MFFDFFEVFEICEAIAYLAIRVSFGFFLLNDFKFRSLLLYYDCFSDSLVLKLVSVFVFPFLYN